MSSPVIVCLGAGLIRRKPEAPLREWIGDATRQRADAAATLWKRQPESLLVMSGGPGHAGPAEADVMRDYVLHEPWSIPADAVLVENASVDTAENVRNVVALLKPGDRVTLVTGANTIKRAAAYFAAYGFRVSSHVAAGEPPTNHDALREYVLRFLQLVDRKGRVATWWKRRLLTRWE